jgi:hypothetical protein
MSDPEPPGWAAAPPPQSPPGPPAPVPQAPEVLPWGPRGPARDYGWVRIVGALLVVALVLAVGYSVRGFFEPAGLRTPPVFPTPTPTPAGFEFQLADKFWNGSALPALAEVSRTLPTINSRCKANLTATCRAAILATDQKVQRAVTVINQGDIPACITDDVTRFKGHLESMGGGLQIALDGYNAGDRLMVAQGLSQFHESLLPLDQDAAAVTKDVRVLCN